MALDIDSSSYLDVILYLKKEKKTEAELVELLHMTSTSSAMIMNWGLRMVPF